MDDIEREYEEAKVWTCTLCGTPKGINTYYNESKDSYIFLCADCLKKVELTIDDGWLFHLTAKQLTRHMEVRDGLAERYRKTFKVTRTFCVGKNRDVPIIEIDEKNQLWSIPTMKMRLALSISTITDVELVLKEGDLDEKDEDTVDLIEELGIKDFLPVVRRVLPYLYRSKHLDLAPIPDGTFVHYLYMKLSLDEHESGLEAMALDLLPFVFPWPSRVGAGYDCAYELITYLKHVASNAYMMQAAWEDVDLDGNDRLSILAARGQISKRDAGVVKYYLERMPKDIESGDYGSSYNLVKNVIDTVSNNILAKESLPVWETQHGADLQKYYGAFYRYASGLTVGDVVYISDKTKIQSGKGGVLFATNSFAVDSFTPDPTKQYELVQPIAYDDLLFVGGGEKKEELVLTFKDGRRFVVDAGRYAHCLFAIVNCIVLLRGR